MVCAFVFLFGCGYAALGDFSLISTELEMIGHTNPTRERGFRTNPTRQRGFRKP